MFEGVGIVQKRDAKAESFTWKEASNDACPSSAAGRCAEGARPAGRCAERVPQPCPRSRVPAAGQSLPAGSAVPMCCTGHRRCRQRALCSDSYLLISGGSWCSGAAAGLSSGCRWSGYFRPRGAALNCVQESRVCAVGKAAGAPEFGAGVCFSSAVPRPGCDVVCGAERPSERLLVLERSAGAEPRSGDTRCISALRLLAF